MTFSPGFLFLILSRIKDSLVFESSCLGALAIEKNPVLDTLAAFDLIHKFE